MNVGELKDWKNTLPKQQKAEIYKAVYFEMKNYQQKFQRYDISDQELKECALALITSVWQTAVSEDDFINRVAETPAIFFTNSVFAQTILLPIRQHHQSRFRQPPPS